MTWGELLRIAKKCKAKFKRHGRKHDIYETLDGERIEIERHWNQEAKPGIAADILKKLGYKK